MDLPDRNSMAPESQEPRWPAPLLIDESRLSPQSTCPWAWSLVGEDPLTGHRILQAVNCGTWACSYCARQKIRRLAEATNLAAPNRLLTLTVNPKLYDCPRTAFEVTSPQVAELIRSLRLRFQPIEYLRVTELTKQGHPHYHLLCRSPYIPHPVIKAKWESLTGAIIVNIRHVHNSFNAYWYLVKYLAKLHKLEWTDRHVSYSRAFFPPGWNSKFAPSELRMKESFQQHPYVFLCQNAWRETVVQLAPSRWDLHNVMGYRPHQPDLARLGLANRESASILQKPEVQKTLL